MVKVYDESYLDDDDVIGVLVLLVEDGVGSNHIVDHIALGDLLGTELLGGRQVLSVVVTQVVVADNGGELQSSGDEEISEHGLDLGLSSLLIING